MNTFEQFIHKVATDSEFRCHVQSNGMLAAGLNREETDAFSSLRHLLQLSTEELQQVLASGEELLVGWF
ncbi:MAG: hypothetical protein KC443_15945 [Anaerolineales bacterium]|nr:hypothetical protein [Anaerolineales bacterium]